MAARLRFAVAFFALLTSISATCYWPPGNETYDRDRYEHQPCSSDPTSPVHTICCALNRTNPSGGNILNGRTNDECLPNGICRNQVLNKGTMQISYWRETCTSKDWKTGQCLDVCADDWTSGNGTTGAIMTPCDGTPGSLKWCCGVDTDCCNKADKVKIIPFEFGGAVPNTSQVSRPATTASSATSALTAVSSTDPAAATTPSSPQEAKSSGGLSTGAKAGIGVGAVIGGLALLALGFLLARRTHKREPKVHSPTATAYEAPAENKAHYAHELPPQPARSELAYTPVPQLSPGMKPTKYGHVAERHEMP